jgi:bacterioferritin-associated ferredoxin
MYICICNAITEKMLQENSFLMAKVGSRCGKCIESGRVFDGERMTQLSNTPSEAKTAKNCYDSDGNPLIL